MGKGKYLRKQKVTVGKKAGRILLVILLVLVILIGAVGAFVCAGWESNPRHRGFRPHILPLNYRCMIQGAFFLIRVGFLLAYSGLFLSLLAPLQDAY